ncbi:MAG: hypothetical protein A3C43_10440 [Candidatus Schekmanbacteria bacterium RIFCSPHIGHO2_02_FULL_38_11]|uniref:histidine kinase n=1 Tax=Candidatus Schekmanbacteria bacterium RIFCSPLOWO2_12_FULL_38_15 TaxID=1817883 RepID=A0A1F7SIX0_9BACT|nr:MAG: hypothetical protein A2043_07240 [Candidatus Schekmanbacteria bacterium GWA2_38_9]OGL49266.1 MAG: hypothetical protein A3H37_04815 [Candidatus Schekmanbacteria bacterium RIFCSPLOWO2_02_FULL_38_14]OGL53721.1 MAG: hypothetical protein A3G31_03170 [Candidatus Schekmanbacteria bacterium RIFCSPLOWO2_12_FULL_38_15]OGL54740.1 MAG: hypothetical protein A3C43_10440 [Candidatus Schekmanbacteria bacterium RIFCSPHIGHO2_02_FULL_38_11]
MHITSDKFIKEIANTFNKIEILSFFNENSGTIDSAEGISQWISRKKDEILQDLEDLVDSGVLQSEKAGDSTLYRYSPTNQLHKIISNILTTKKLYQSKIKELEKEKENIEDQFLKEIIREKSKTGTIIESMNEGILVLSKNLQLLTINNVAKDIFSIKEEKVLGKRLSELTENKENIQKIEKILFSGNNSEEDLLFVFNKNNIYKISFSLLKDEHTKELIGYVLVFNDITKEKETEKIKTEFISMFTHDLKNPLNAIILNSDYLIEKIQKHDDDTEANFLKMINDSGKRILRIIEDFLSVSIIDAGMLKLNFDEVNYDKLLSLTAYTFSFFATEKGLQIETEIPSGFSSVWVDRLQMERVLENLLSNAIKFTPNGGKIKISAFEKNGSIFTCISDTGIGISKGDLPNLFNKYYRSQKVSNIKGTGLGLSIVKSIIDAHKGEISVESEEDKGTTFTFQLPIGKP